MLGAKYFGVEFAERIDTSAVLHRTPVSGVSKMHMLRARDARDSCLRNRLVNVEISGVFLSGTFRVYQEGAPRMTPCVWSFHHFLIASRVGEIMIHIFRSFPQFMT